MPPAAATRLWGSLAYGATGRARSTSAVLSPAARSAPRCAGVYQPPRESDRCQRNDDVDDPPLAFQPSPLLGLCHASSVDTELY
jgi:hypothetical protein